MTAAPSFRHQRISARLHVLLHDLLEAPGHGIVVAAPVGVEFPATVEVADEEVREIDLREMFERS